MQLQYINGSDTGHAEVAGNLRSGRIGTEQPDLPVSTFHGTQRINVSGLTIPPRLNLKGLQEVLESTPVLYLLYAAMLKHPNYRVKQCSNIIDLSNHVVSEICRLFGVDFEVSANMTNGRTNHKSKYYNSINASVAITQTLKGLTHIETLETIDIGGYDNHPSPELKKVLKHMVNLICNHMGFTYITDSYFCDWDTLKEERLPNIIDEASEEEDIEEFGKLKNEKKYLIWVKDKELDQMEAIKTKISKWKISKDQSIDVLRKFMRISPLIQPTLMTLIDMMITMVERNFKAVELSRVPLNHDEDCTPIDSYCCINIVPYGHSWLERDINSDIQGYRECGSVTIPLYGGAIVTEQGYNPPVSFSNTEVEEFLYRLLRFNFENLKDYYH